MFNQSVLKLVVGFGLCTLGGAMLYVYFKQEEEEEKLRRDIVKNAKEKKQKMVTAKLPIANEHVPLILGRSGANLKEIENKTQTQIRFRDKSTTHKFCDISGYAENVKMAYSLIMKEVERSPIVKEEIYIPANISLTILGQCGDYIQEICRQTLAKISVDAILSTNSEGRRLIITGTRLQVNLAIKMLEEKIAQNLQLQSIDEQNELKRQPRRSPSSSPYSSQLSLHMPSREKLNSKLEQVSMEVYVSAIASPSKFWVQLIGPQTKKLDIMIKEMTEYYEDPKNRKMHEITAPYLGQIVAALFKFDGKWYRAQIVGILPNEFNKDEVVMDLYFVDYGDSEYVGIHEVYELRTDFLTLRFQAIECYLAGIKSNNSTKSDSWDVQSIQKFEELTQVASWKKLMSKVITYKDRTKPTLNEELDSREGSPIPGVELYDMTDGMELNIGQVLISEGLAKPDNENIHNLNLNEINWQDSPRSNKSEQTDISSHNQTARSNDSNSTFQSAKSSSSNLNAQKEDIQDSTNAKMNDLFAAQMNELKNHKILQTDKSKRDELLNGNYMSLNENLRNGFNDNR